MDVVRLKIEGLSSVPCPERKGEAEFNEVYMTHVRLPDEFRLGDVNEGWRVAMTTLTHERVAIGGGQAPGAATPSPTPSACSPGTEATTPSGRPN